jgi:hypothetical protein
MNDQMKSRVLLASLLLVLALPFAGCSVEEDGIINVGVDDWFSCAADSIGLYEPTEVKGFLDGVAGGEGRTVVVGIAGPGPKICKSEFGEANNARRLQEFIALYKENGVFGDICAGDIWTTLERALEVMKVSCDSFPPVV